MVRSRGKLDACHKSIVRDLEDRGAVILDLSAVGMGCPDILWGYNGDSGFFEIKAADSGWEASKSRTAQRQRVWAEAWPGVPVVVVTTPEDAVFALETIVRGELVLMRNARYVAEHGFMRLLVDRDNANDSEICKAIGQAKRRRSEKEAAVRPEYQLRQSRVRAAARNTMSAAEYRKRARDGTLK